MSASVLMDNIGFVGVCILIAAIIVAIAKLMENLLCKDIKKFSSTHFITYTAVFACMAGVLMTVEIPLFFAPAFYKLDFSEVPVLICTFYLGPVAGVAAEFLKVMIKLLIKGTSSAFVGDFANFVVGCSLILPASIIYHARPGRRSSIIGMAVGTVVLAVFGSLFNALYLIPTFATLYGMPIDSIIAMGTAVNKSITDITSLVFFAVVPFNLLKGIVVSAVTFALYKRISPILHKGDNMKIKRQNKA